jgi:hypothetical protein
MSVPVRIKRRWTGLAGAPASLKSGELAYNGMDDTLYIGFGDDGGGNATSIKSVAGLGLLNSYAPLASPAFTGVPTGPTAAGGTSNTQLATTAFVQAAVTSGSVADGDKGDIVVTGSGGIWNIEAGAVTLAKMADIATATFLGRTTAATGVVEALTVGQAKTMLNLAGTNSGDQTITLTGDVTGTGTGTFAATIAAGAVNNAKLATMAANTIKGNATGGVAAPTDLTAASVKTLLSLNNVDNTTDAAKPVSTAQATALALKANLASPAFTGVPTAPTAAPGTNTTQVSTTAFVQAAVAALVDGAPGAIDTLNELAAALGDDPNFATTVTNSIAAKLAIANNLSDLNNVGTARSNLGLGTMALQNASAVAITGGTIDGVVIDGGTF